jgi:hypothetical protein
MSTGVGTLVCVHVPSRPRVCIASQVSESSMSEVMKRVMDAAELNGFDNVRVVRLVDLVVDRSIAADSL